MKKLIFLYACLLVMSSLNSQSKLTDNIEIHGDFQTDFQYYKPDSLIGAADVPEKMGNNTYLNLLINKGENLSAGVRFEMYQPALQGFDPRYNGLGFPYKFINWRNESFDITIGNFYEQYGNALILRSYQDWGLGYDNSFYGLRFKYSPIKGVDLKSMIGKQRLYWEYGEGSVRGADLEVNFNSLFQNFENSRLRVSTGASFVSKYQKANDPVINIPENVPAYSGRLNIGLGGFSIIGEYAEKYNDPSASNSLIFKKGQALLLNTTYSYKTLGITVIAKRVDNMDYRSDRLAIGNDLLINYIPASTSQSTYSLLNLYQYPSQPMGEMVLQSNIFYTAPKGTMIGGKYGTKFWLNVGRINTIDKEPYLTKPESYLGYQSEFLKLGDEILFNNIHAEITKKMTSKQKVVLSYAHVVSNDELLQMTDYHKQITADIAVIDYSYKIIRSNTIRTELQHLSTKNDRGNWTSFLLEYTASKYFFAFNDDYNYGNKNEDLQLHYAMVHAGLMKEKSRLSFSYGKRKQGIICVGGVCRQMPATNGFSLNFTTSF